MKKVLSLLTLILTGSIIIYSQEKMELNGAIVIKDSQEEIPEEGTIQWDGTDLLGWNGIRWTSLTNYASIGTVTDIEGNIYQTVRIGDQVWMAENLRTKSYNDNTTIEEVTDDPTWAGLTTGARCWYNNDINNDIFLYNWYAVDTNKLCPTGWNVPTQSDLTNLSQYLGGADIAGGWLKAIGTSQWASPNTGATNETGFTGVPTGIRFGAGSFSATMDNITLFWSETENGNNAIGRELNYNSASFYQGDYSKNAGISVRCIQN